MRTYRHIAGVILAEIPNEQRKGKLGVVVKRGGEFHARYEPNSFVRQEIGKFQRHQDAVRALVDRFQNERRKENGR